MMGSQTPASDVPGADFRARAVRTTQERRPDIDPRAIALSLTLARIAGTHQYQSERLVHRRRGWSFSGFRVLYMIWLTEPVEARDLARFAGVSRQTTSTVLSTLEAARLVVRRQTSKTDRRLVSVRLTARGRAAVNEAIGAQNAVESAWFSVLTGAEQEQLQDMLERVLARIDRPLDAPDAPVAD
jgi:DNA-binding MarR family transcriptional regulator